MRRLSACSQEIEQASQQISIDSETGRPAFNGARRKLVTAIERFTGFIESIVVKISQIACHSPTLTDEDATQHPESSTEDMDMD